MLPSIPTFRNEINALEDFRGGIKVARNFAVRLHVSLKAADAILQLAARAPKGIIQGE